MWVGPAAGNVLTGRSRGAEPLPRAAPGEMVELRNEDCPVLGTWQGDSCVLVSHRRAGRQVAGGRSSEFCPVRPWPVATLRFQQGVLSPRPLCPWQRGA